MSFDIASILNKTNSKPLLYSSGDKIYKFTNSDYPLDYDYIYISMPQYKEDRFDKIKFHLKNPNCKGFFISESDTKLEQYLKILYEFNPQNVFCSRNVYNTGFQIAKLIAQDLNLNLIILAGTDGLKELRKKISFNLGIENLQYDEYWQKALDSVLRSGENTKYAIVETNLSRPNNADYIANIKKEAYVLYSKISYPDFNLYKDYEGFCDEWLKLSKNEPSKIYAIESDYLKLNRNDVCYSDDICSAFLNDLGISQIKEIEEDDFKKVTIEKTQTPYSVKKSLKEFCEKNKDKNKIVILDKIKNISKEDEKQCYKYILDDTDFDTVILIGLSKMDVFLRKNKNILIKEYQKLSDNNLISVKQFIDCFKKEDSVYFISSEDKKLCNLI